MNPNKALWEKGDFTRIAETMRTSGEALVERLGIRKGLKVLDLGCGDGTTAIPAARRGADVLGVDIASNLVVAGNERASRLGLANCRFQEGDASSLSDLPEDRFDLVVSIFGAMFAPKPHDVAREMVRVTRSGGRIVMGNWIPGDPTLVAQILKISAARFGGAGVARERISFSRDTWFFNHPGSPSSLVETFRDYYGPTMNAFEAAGKSGRESELQRELEDLFARQNTAPDRNTTSIPATFLRVTVEV
jgi:SAM-dependent methyltransferase